MSAWQPIETAPKDGTVVVLCLGPDGDNQRFYVAWWDGEEWTDFEGQFVTRLVTHWTPLPAPPTEPPP